MAQTKESHWLSYLPAVGHDVAIVLKDGQAKAMEWVNLSYKDGVLVIEELTIRKDEAFPTIVRVSRIHEDDISEITFVDEKDPQIIRYLKRPNTEWLKKLPRTKECQIFVFTKDRSRLLEIPRGWIESDEKKIYLNKIIGAMKNPLTGMLVIKAIRYEREIQEVISISVSIKKHNPQIFVRTVKA